MLYSELSDPMSPPVIASDVDYLRSSGDTVAGVGAAYFSTTTTGSPYARTFTAADSRVFEMLPEQDGWSLAAFGMLPNTKAQTAQSTINAAAHQQAVDNAIWLHQNGHGVQRLVFTPGQYFIDQAIQVFKYTGGTGQFDYISIEIAAPARGYINTQRTAITNTDDQQPCYAVQSARSVKFEGFSIVGVDNGVTPVNLTYANLVGDPSVWSNVQGLRDDAWSPACAVVVDPFGTTPPGGGYPGMSSYYGGGARGSSATVFENMECQGFPVGICLSPSTDTQNNDSVMIRDCDISYNTVAVATCQSQNRAVRIENCRIHASHVAIDTRAFGNGDGAFPLAKDLNVTFCKFLLNATGGVCRAKIINSDVESTYSLGAWHGAFPLDIEGCQIKLIPPVNMTSPQQPNIDYHLYNLGAVNIIGGYVGFYSGVPVPLSIGGSGRVNFTGCAIDCPPLMRDPEVAKYEGVTLRYLNGGNVYGADMQFVALSDSRLAIQRDAKMPPDGTASFYQPYARFRNVGGSMFVNLAPAVTITATGDGLATFTAPTPGKFNVGEWITTIEPLYGVLPDPGSPTVELRQVSIGKVKSIVGSTVTLDAVPISLTTGSYTPYAQYLPSFRPRCYGTATASSNILTGVTPASHGFQPGDRLVASEGIPDGAYVVSVDAGANTITISLDATSSGLARIRTGELYLDDAPRSSAPGSGTVTYVGDYFRNTAASVDGDDMVLRGWIATSIGAPGNLEPQYVSTVSPAT